MAEPDRLGPTARSIIEDPGSRLLLSAASSWEIAIKYAVGRLPLPEPPEVYVPTRMTKSGTEGLSIEHHHTLQVAQLELHHSDPFDRLLIAQAQVEGLPILTADPIFSRYEVEVIPAD